MADFIYRLDLSEEEFNKIKNNLEDTILNKIKKIKISEKKVLSIVRKILLISYQRFGAKDGTWTHTSLQITGPQPVASAIPPLSLVHFYYTCYFLYFQHRNILYYRLFLNYS